MYKKKRGFSLSALALSIALTGCSGNDEVNTQSTSAVADVKEVATQSYSQAISAEEIRNSAYDIATRAGAWQIEQLGNLNYIPESHRAKSENAKF